MRSKFIELFATLGRRTILTIVEYSQADLQKTDADIQDTEARHQYHWSRILLEYEIGTPR